MTELARKYDFDFNSQPHKEADGSAWDIHSLCHISTHSLTRRLTLEPEPADTGRSISTHSLTRRLTSYSRPKGL